MEIYCKEDKSGPDTFKNWQFNVMSKFQQLAEGRALAQEMFDETVIKVKLTKNFFYNFFYLFQV